MKKINYSLMLIAAAAVSFTACQKEVNDTSVVDPDAIQITVKAVPEEIKTEDGSKTYIDANKTILWGTGEYMRLALTAGEKTTFATSTDASADTFNGDPEAMFEFSVTPETASEYVYQGLYPASAAPTSNNTNAANYKVNLPAVQNATAASYDPAAYIMVAKPETFTSVQTDWEASFRRATALNKVTLKNVPSGVSFNKVKITATGKKLAGGRHFNLTAGEGLEVYGTDASIDVLYATPVTGTNVDVWFTSWDAEIAEGEKLTIVAYTTDSKSYTKEITVPAGKTISFKEGFLNTLGANLSGIAPKDVTELDPGNYVVLAKDGSNYYALKAEKEDGKERLLSVEYTGDLNSYSGNAALVWTLTKSGNSFVFENDGKYLGYKGSSNESYWLEAGENWIEANYLLDVTAQETAGQYHVTVHSNSARYLSKNSSGAFFAFYGNTGQKADIVFVPATVDTRDDVTLSFSDAVVNLTTSAGSFDNFFGQSVTADPNVAAITGAITWSYEDNDGIIDDFDEGDLLLTGDPGTATITASFAGDSNYKPATASYTINVTSNSEPTWEETNLADIGASDVFVIVGNGSYAINNTVNSSSSPTAVSVTVSGTQLTGTIPETIKWNVAAVTGGYTFYPNGDSEHWLGSNTTASSSSNTSIRVATANRKVWELDASNHLLTNDTYADRYLAVYNGSDWRGYLNTNSSPTTFKFYKYTVNDGKADAGVSLSYSGGAVTYGDNPVQLTLTNPHSVTVTCSSSETGVATVTDAALATIVGAGTTTITAAWDEQTISGTTYRAGSVTYELTVAKKTPTIAAFNNPVTSVAKGSTVTNTTTISDNLTITYTSSKTNVATVSSAGVVTGVDDGTATISATFAGNANFNAATSQSYTITVGTGGGSSVPEPIVITPSSGFLTSYGSKNAFDDATLEGYAFKVQQVANYSSKIQWRAAGNSNGTGILYNVDAMPAGISSIVIVYNSSDTNKNHTVKIGSSANPTSSSSITPSISGNTYTFAGDGTSEYFVITNGSGAGYMDSITINFE